MGCTSSKESGPHESKRAVLYGSDTNLPNQRYLSDPPQKHVKFDSSTFTHKSVSGKAVGFKEARTKAVMPRETPGETARPKETFEAYARRGVIRQSALLPEGAQSARTKDYSQKKRVGGYQKYMQE